MQKGILKTKKGYTASEINFYVDDDGDIRYSYEVEPIEPKYKAGDIVMFMDGTMLTVFDWNGGENASRFLGHYVCLRGGYTSTVSCDTDRLWLKDKVVGLATAEQVFQYHKAFKDAGYEWDSEKMEFVEYVWKPKKGEDYYYVDREGQIRCLQNTEHHTDFRMYNFNNYFRTKEAAQVAADQIKEVLKNARKE